MAKPTKKPAADRQRRNKPKVVDIREYQLPETPEPPPDLLPSTVEWWEMFWASELIRTVHASVDTPAVVRLAEMIDLRQRYFQETKEQPLVPGSRGNLVENPLAKSMRSLDIEIRNLEDRFGLNPRSRLNLGVTFGAAKKSLEDMMGRWHEEEQEPPEVEDLDGVIDV